MPSIVVVPFVRPSSADGLSNAPSALSVDGYTSKPKNRKGIPIWVLLLVTSVFMVVSVSVSITLISYFNGKYTITTLSSQIRLDMMNYMTSKVINSLSSPVICQSVMQGFFNSDTIQQKGSLQNRTEYLKLLDSLTFKFPEVTFIGFASPTYVMTLYKLNGISQPPLVIINDATTNGTSNFYLINFTTNALIQPPLFGIPYTTDTDPGFILMEKVKQPLWSALQVAPNGDLSSGLQYPLLNSTGGFVGFTMASYSLATITEFLLTVQPTPNSRALIVDQNGNLIATNLNGNVSYIDSTGTPALYSGLNASGNLDDELIKSSTKHFLGISWANETRYSGNFHDRKLGTILIDIFPFNKIDGFNQPQYPLNWYLILSIPENDFVGSVNRNFHTSIIITVVFAVLGILMSVVISLFITRPLSRLSESMNSVARLDILADDFTTKRTPRFLLPLAEIQSMKKSFEHMRNGIISFGKFVPVDYVRYLLQSNKEAHRSLHHTNCTVLFMDIVGFTSMSEKMSPQKLEAVLGKFFDEMSTIILGNEGTIDKYIGDCVMAVWNTPRSVDKHPVKACWAAVQCMLKLEQSRQQFEELGAPNFRCRIGLHTGPVLAGNVGSRHRLNFTVLGDTVNVSSRLEALNKKLQLPGILVSAAVQQAVQSDPNLVLESSGDHILDGRKAPVSVYCLDPIASSARKLRLN